MGAASTLRMRVRCDGRTDPLDAFSIACERWRK